MKKNFLNHKTIVARNPKKLFPQETDWTCSIACIRTILSSFIEQVPSEHDFIKLYDMKPGPHYSKDIKEKRILNNKCKTIYGCDIKHKNFDLILDYMESGYCIMLESLYNYSHWMVLLAYYPLNNSNIEKSELLMYDPYYDKIRIICVDEFISMWCDGDYLNNGIIKDFIAIKSAN